MTINFKTTLMSHQAEAVEKLKNLKVGALFMEQGTGKTRTTLEIINHKLEKNKIDSVVWFCPCSVKQNLRDDIEYHCGAVPEFFHIVGTESISSSDRLYLRLLEHIQTHSVFLVVDESAMVKNPTAMRTKRIMQFAELSRYRFILNGTPVARNEADLWAQYCILDWRIMGYRSYYTFAANHIEYVEIKTPDGRKVKTDRIAYVYDIDYLTQRITPYTYQIKKEECLQLPRKHYYAYYFEMTDLQQSVYLDVRERYLENVDEFRDDTIYKLFTALQHVSSGRAVISEPTERMSTTSIFGSIYDNPRIEALAELLPKIGDEKCIIFVKFKQEAEEIKRLLTDKGISFAEFTGSVNQKRRQENKRKFRDGTQVLISNKSCGAYGLNLQFCHNIIFYNNDFNYATRIQSEDRIHRMGQTEDCYIYDIVADNSIDTFISRNLDGKESLAAAFKRQLHELKKTEKDEKEKQKLGLYAIAETRDDAGGLTAPH